jgi:2'-5' RNA ligase
LSLSCFVVLVPAAEPLVSAARNQFDSSARRGLGAHITVLYPFMDPARIDAAVLKTAQTAIDVHEQFSFQLKAIEYFSKVAYLKPEPADPFIALSLSLARAFPLFPPYGGEFAKIAPHLTLAKGDVAAATQVLAQIAADLAAQGAISTHCSAVTLVENSSGGWRPLHELKLEPCAD